MNIFCDECRTIASHDKLTSEEYVVILSAQEYQTDTGRDVSSHWKNYALFRCVACSKNIVFVKQDCCSEYDGSPYGDIEVFPKPSERLIPEWHDRLDPAISGLMKQSCKAFNEGLYSLALMGYRAVIDYWLTSKVGDINGGFAKKLDTAFSQAVINEVTLNNLKALVEAGHAVTHRKHSFNKEDSVKIMDCIDIILHENLTPLQQDIANCIKEIKVATPVDERVKLPNA